MFTKTKITLFLTTLLPVFGVIASPAQDSLSYLQYTGDYWQVYVKQGDAAEKKISTSTYDKSSVSWLSDGIHVFVCGVQGQAEIINTVTGASETVVLPKSKINDAVISPDGSTIAYSYIDDSSVDNKLWLYDRSKKTDKLFKIKEQGRQYDPKWNVQGTALYYVTGVANTEYDINMANIADMESKRVIFNSKYNLDVDVSVSGKIAYSSNLKNSFDIWVKDGDKTTRLTDFSGSETKPSWSQDEKTIYFEQMHNGILNIWSIDVADGAIKQITFSENGARLPVALNKGIK